MRYAKLGASDIPVSRLSLGTATFGKQTDEVTSGRIMDRCAEAGVTFFDSAGSYPMDASPDQTGRTEEIVGRWLKGKRGDFVIGTKELGLMGRRPWDGGAVRKHFMEAVDGSLRRLGTDYIDLYSIHFDDPSAPLEEIAEAFDRIVASGKARCIGASNFLAYRLARVVGIQDTRRLARFVCVQPRYNLLFREIERELLPLAVEENIAVTPFNPLAGGLLTAKYRPRDEPIEGRFSPANGKFGEAYQQRYWHDREFDAIDRLVEAAAAANIPMTTLAIAWILANPAITSVILGASKCEQLDDTLHAAEVVLSSELKLRLDDLTAEFRKGDATR